MRKTILHLAAMLAIPGCNNSIQKTDQNPAQGFKCICYSDSSYQTGRDTFHSASDTIFPLQLQGYCRIVSQQYGQTSEGLVHNGLKEGLWKIYEKWPVARDEQPDASATYKNGMLNGPYTEYMQHGDKFAVYMYQHNIRHGLQQECYPNGKPALVYSLDVRGNMVFQYMAFNENGDTLYHTNFGKTATGHVKQYNRWGILEQEGTMINGKMDTFKAYEYNRANDKYEKVRTYVSTDTSMTCIKEEPAPKNMNVKRF